MQYVQRARRQASRSVRRGSSASWLLAAAAVMFLASAGATILSAQASGKTVWDGAYTRAQAERAHAAFQQSCAGCHTLTTQGESPLAGEVFWEGYSQKAVGDLLTYVKNYMPNGNGNSLPQSSYNDIVALILQSNGLPPGGTELGPETTAHFQIIPKDGPGELPANALVRIVGCLAKSGNDWVLTSATSPERIEKTGVGPADATRPLGSRTMTLKFSLTRLDPMVGRRLSVSGMLIGTGGADGLNVTTVNQVAASCP